MENARVIKSVRNDVNRQTNAEIANQAKAASASVDQLFAIRTVLEAHGMGNLPPALQEFHQAARGLSDATLKELGQRANPPLSKSAVLPPRSPHRADGRRGAGTGRGLTGAWRALPSVCPLQTPVPPPFVRPPACASDPRRPDAFDFPAAPTLLVPSTLPAPQPFRHLVSAPQLFRQPSTPRRPSSRSLPLFALFPVGILSVRSLFGEAKARNGKESQLLSRILPEWLQRPCFRVYALCFSLQIQRKTEDFGGSSLPKRAKPFVFGSFGTIWENNFKSLTEGRRTASRPAVAGSSDAGDLPSGGCGAFGGE